MRKFTPITNAWIPDELTLRVGVPHFGGALPAHCSEEDVPTMVSAGARWRPGKRQFAAPSSWGWTTDHCDTALDDRPLRHGAGRPTTATRLWTTDHCDTALDSAGYVAMKDWASKGRQPGMKGIYPWSLQDYLQLVVDVWPRWWSQPDACVEPEIAGDAVTVAERCAITTELLEASLQQAVIIAERMGGHFRPPVPVIQGWKAEQYRESLLRVLDVWDRVTNGTMFERMPTLIGVGSVCRRSLHHPEHGLFRVLDAIASEIPENTRLHLFGVKGDAVTGLRHYGSLIASVDSMAYDFAARIAARSAGVSNTMEHRIGHLERWRGRHDALMAAADQQGSLPLWP